ISDAIVDAYLTAYDQSRCGIETLVTTNRIIVAGEARGPDSITPALIEEIARSCVKEIGYDQDNFHWQKADVQVYHHTQAAAIAAGVDAAGNKDEAAGDRDLMFGYACNETDALMPAPIHFSHAILRSLSRARHTGALPHLGPDSKS